MIVYVNGDSHAAAAEAAAPYGWEGDDGDLDPDSKRPHPANLAVSWGKKLSELLGWRLICDAQSGGSNQRIMRTTRQWIDANPALWSKTLLVLQWSTWERQEWLHNDEYYQVGASGIDSVPPELCDHYKCFVSDIDWQHCVEQSHNQIWQFHQELQQRKIAHVMFNGNSDLSSAPGRHDWTHHYINPYQQAGTYDSVLRANGFVTVTPTSWHFGPDAHCFWAKFVLNYLHSHNLLPIHALPTD